jgi:hypothetical protein
MRASGCQVIAAYVLIQAAVGEAFIVAAAPREVRGVRGGGEPGGPCEALALVTSPGPGLDGVRRAMMCSVAGR